MEYNILLETDFFNLLNAGHKNKGGNALENSYREFIKVVVDLCTYSGAYPFTFRQLIRV